MSRQFTLEYWIDDDWYVGRLKEVPGVFSQGESLSELEQNIADAYRLMMADEGPPLPSYRSEQKKCRWNCEPPRLRARVGGVGLLSEAARHSTRHLREPRTGRRAPVPRHNDIKDSLCQLIRKQLGL